MHYFYLVCTINETFTILDKSSRSLDITTSYEAEELLL
jgi:hypothetical protein